MLAFSLDRHTKRKKIINVQKKNQGRKNTTDFRVFAKDKEDNRTISFWHDIPLRNADGTLNMVTEIPRETRAKFEVSTKENSNPIAQDLKKPGPGGKPTLRDYSMPIHWNYGMFPQTWEDPAHEHAEIKGAGGDNDPLDVVEIGNATLPTGSVTPVKPVGILAMIDQGELDWKVSLIERKREKKSGKARAREREIQFRAESRRAARGLRRWGPSVSLCRPLSPSSIFSLAP